MKRLTMLILIIWGFCLACESSTPKQYQNHDTISRKVYEQHKMTLTDSISAFIKQKQTAYYQRENDSLTEIFIDTILYSPQKDKIAFFVITKNSNDKLLSGGNKNEYHFNAHCFIAYLGDNYLIKDISWLSAYNLSNYKSLRSASVRIRQIHFKEFRRKGSDKFKYNLDDRRFWSSSLWDSE